MASGGMGTSRPARRGCVFDVARSAGRELDLGRTYRVIAVGRTTSTQSTPPRRSLPRLGVMRNAGPRRRSPDHVALGSLHELEIRDRCHSADYRSTGLGHRPNSPLRRSFDSDERVQQRCATQICTASVHEMLATPCNKSEIHVLAYSASDSISRALGRSPYLPARSGPSCEPGLTRPIRLVREGYAAGPCFELRPYALEQPIPLSAPAHDPSRQRFMNIGSTISWSSSHQMASDRQPAFW